MFSRSSFIGLTVAHVVIEPLHGFCNVVVYFGDPLRHTFVLKRFLLLYQCCCTKREESIGAVLEPIAEIPTEGYTKMEK